MSEEKKEVKGGFLQGFGSGAIIILVVAAGYVFGLKEDPKEALTNSVQQTYAVVTVGEQAVGELKVTMPDMTPAQLKKLEETEKALADVREEVKNIGALLNIPLVPETTEELPEPELKEVDAKIVPEKVEEVVKEAVPVESVKEK